MALLATGIGIGCAVGPRELRGQEVSGLDRKLSRFAYIEEGDLVTLIISVKGARYRGDEPYVPLEICIANSGLKKLRLSRESFTLVDAEGNRYPLAGTRELIEGYEFLDFDRGYRELDSIVFNKMANYHRYGSSFSPTRGAGAGLVRDRVVLPRFGYLIDFVYFPRPATGVEGATLELFLSSPDLEDPVFVRFNVS